LLTVPEGVAGMGQWYWYQPLGEERVRILRVFGRESYVVLPRQIGSGRVAEIADYCFSEREPGGDIRICSDGEEFLPDRDFVGMCEREGLLPLAGRNVTGVELPDSLTRIGNFAFYQCRELEKITLGTGEVEVGSDAFMNCRSLSSFYFRGSPGESSCLKQILAQRSGETSIYFMEGEQTQAALVYPEYSEHYDLIGPAHIFELNIQGEGFRARQCFQNGVVDFGAYDRIFSLECGEESVDTLCRMACSRLQYPWGLQARQRELYEAYLSENIHVVCEHLVEERNLPGIQAFYKLGLLKSGAVQECLERAVAGNWTEGVRQLLSLREGEGKEGTEYAFEDF